MKYIVSILCVFLFWQISFCQNGKTLKIRKLQYDTLFYTQEFHDTATNFTEQNFSPLSVSTLTNGTWFGNIFFTNDSLFVFTQLISSKQKNLALNKPNKFWKKINRKSRKGKLTYYTTWYSFKQNDTRYNIATTTKTYCRITEKGNNKIVFDKKIALDSSVDYRSQIISDYTYLSGLDTVFLDRKVFNINTICNNSGDYFGCLFRTLIGNLKGHYNYQNPFGYFKTSSKIYKNRYEMYFDFENYLVKKVTIAENYKVKYYCDFDIDKDSIYIMNCPATELGEGRIARKNNKIKFRHQSKNYSFYLKNRRNIYTSRGGYLFGKRQTGHYALKLAQ